MSTRRFAQRESRIDSRNGAPISHRQVPFLYYSDDSETTPLAHNILSRPRCSEAVNKGQGFQPIAAHRTVNCKSEPDAPSLTPQKPCLLELEMIAIDALTHLRAHNSIQTSSDHPGGTPILRRHVSWTRTDSSSSFATSSSALDSYPSEYFSSDEDNSLAQASSRSTFIAPPPISRTLVGPDSGQSEAEEEGPLSGLESRGGADDGHHDVKGPTPGRLGLVRRRISNGRSSQILGGSSPTPDYTDESVAASDSDSGSTYSDAKRRASTSRRQSHRPRKRRRAQLQREDSQSSISSHSREVLRPRFKRRPQAMPEVHNAKARRYPCRIPGCTWAFARSPERTRHEATHNEREMWKCGHCGLLLSRKDSALRHHYTQHRNEEVQITRAALS